MPTNNFTLINIGSGNNARDGDTLRSAFQKINQNFSEIDDLIEGYFVEFLSQTNQLPTNIIPITPNTNVNISSTGTGIITLTAPTVQISNNVSIGNDVTIGGTLAVSDKFTAFGDAEFKGDVEFDGTLSLNDVNLLGAKIDCGRF